MKYKDTVDRFHQAAKDGHVDLLKEASKRDLNDADADDGMTAVHWAAFHGRLEALRVIIGRGGDVDKQDVYGNAPLHLAVRRRHMNCVSFIVNFGCNIWALDCDGHTALDVAGEIVDQEVAKYLDTEMNREALTNPRQCEKRKLKSLSDFEKRAKKMQTKINEDDLIHKNSFPQNQEVSALPVGEVGPERTAKKISKLRQTLRQTKATIRTLSRSGNRTSQPTFSDYLGQSRKSILTESSKKIDQVIYSAPSTSTSIGTNDSGIMSDIYVVAHEPEQPASIFNRPGWGSIAFRDQPIADVLQNVPKVTKSKICNSRSFLEGDGSTSSIAELNGASGGSDQDTEDLPWQIDELGLNDDECSPLETFLAANNLEDYLMWFTREKITLEALMLLTERDLIQLEIPMGPRKILLEAIYERNVAMNKPTRIIDVRF